MALDLQEMEKPVRKLRKLLKKLPKQPSPKQVHAFRTNSRRLEATLEALDLDATRQGRRILKPLGRVRKRAGKVRDMDVLTGYVANLRQPDGEQECATELLEYLGAERQRYAKKLYSTAQKRRTRLRKQLKRGQKKFRELRADAEVANHSAPASVLQITTELNTPARLNHGNLHPFRLKVKELRNVLKLADRPDEKLDDLLGQVKDSIGEWHDYEELVSIAEKVLDHGPECKLIRALKELTRNKFQAALARAERLRQQQLGKSKDRRTQAPSPSKPVWTAAMKLAA
jgi:CHAD domain-containing protein